MGRKWLPSGLKSERQCGLVGGHSWDGTFEFNSHLCSSPPLRPGFVAFCTSATLCSFYQRASPLGGNGLLLGLVQSLA